jgi:cell migration-inducing and hyaluronan-binding protein
MCPRSPPCRAAPVAPAVRFARAGRLCAALLLAALVNGCADQGRLDSTESLAQEAGASGIVGQIDGLVVKDQQFGLSGWACDRGAARSIGVHVYAGGPAGTGTFVKAAQANLPNEAGVDVACVTTGVPHRFLIPIAPDDVRRFGGQGLFVHGLSLSGKANLLIGNSGKFSLPKNLVIGAIDGIARAGAAYVARGWACDLGFPRPIAVHAYAGGPASKGTIFGSAIADRPAEDAVNDACATPRGGAHRFELPLDEAVVRDFGGKFLFVHGIRPAGSDGPGNLLLGRSGVHSIPETLSIAWSQLKARFSKTEALWAIPAHLDVTLDESPLVWPLVHVKGKLRCGRRNLALELKGLMFDGEKALFECGTEAAPFAQKLDVTLRGSNDEEGFHDAHGCDPLMPMHRVSGPQSVIFKCGARLSLHGKASQLTWTRLAQAVEPLISRPILMLRDAVDWPVGSRIAIASTSFDFKQADEAVIAAVDATGKQLTLEQPLRYRHLGSATKYTNGKGGPNARTFVLDESAEVALLSRNIVFRGTECDGVGTLSQRAACIADVLDVRNKRGGHLMITSMDETPMAAVAQVDGVEFINMGRLTEMGRYPMHWHRVGTTAGDYLKRSSIHHSFQRCVTLHGTNKVLLEDNVCFDHYGHGYFLEDGNEVDNVFRNNVGFVSRRPPIQTGPGGAVSFNRGLLFSDNQNTSPERWASPATFWISNPGNHFEGNVAAGSEGSGFWFALVNQLACQKAGHHECRVVAKGSVPPSVDEVVFRPNNTPLGRFLFNVAHSGMVGVTTDGGPVGEIVAAPRTNKLGEDRMTDGSHYSPRADGLPSGSRVRPEYGPLSIWRNRGAGFYFRGDAAEVTESVLAENYFNTFFDYNQTLSHSLVVGLGPNLTDEEAVKQVKGRTFLASRLYDGPFSFINVHLAGLSPKTFTFGSTTYALEAVPFVLIGGANKSPVNTVRAVTLANSTPIASLDFMRGGDAWADLWGAGLFDADGTLTGVAGSTLIPGGSVPNADGTPLITAYAECTKRDDLTAFHCPATLRFGSIFIGAPSFNATPEGVPTIEFTLNRVKFDAAAPAQRRVVGRFDYAQYTAQMKARVGRDTNLDCDKLSVPAYPDGYGYRYFSGKDYAFELNLPALSTAATCTAAAPCAQTLTFKYVKLNDTSPIVRLRLPPGTHLAPGSFSGLAKATHESDLELASVLTTSAWYDWGDGARYSVRFKATAPASYVLSDAPFDATGTIRYSVIRD